MLVNGPARLIGRDVLAGLKVGERGRLPYPYLSLSPILRNCFREKGSFKLIICLFKTGQRLEDSSGGCARVSYRT